MSSRDVRILEFSVHCGRCMLKFVVLLLLRSRDVTVTEFFYQELHIKNCVRICKMLVDTHPVHGRVHTSHL